MIEPDSPRRELAPRSKRRQDDLEPVAGLAAQASVSDSRSAKRSTAVAGGEHGRRAQPVATGERPETDGAGRPILSSAIGGSVTGRAEPAARGTGPAAAQPAITSLAAALQAQAEGVVADTAFDGAPEGAVDAGEALAAGAKRLAAKGGGDSPPIAASGVPGAKDAANKADKSGAEPVVDLKAATKAGAAAQDAGKPAATDSLQVDQPAPAGGDRPASTPTPSPLPATSGVQPHAAPATPGLHVGAQLSAGLAAQVAGEIAANAGSRRTRFEVRLDPAELGRVDVRLDIAHDGRVQTRLIVERPETLDMLRHDARELARTLEQAGFQLGQGGLAFQLKEGRADLWEAAERRGVAAKAEAEAQDEPAPAAYRRTPAAGGVDMMV